MGRIKQSRVNSRRMRTARRALGDRPTPHYERGTRFFDGKDRRLTKVERQERVRLRDRAKALLANAVKSEGGAEDAGTL